MLFVVFRGCSLAKSIRWRELFDWGHYLHYVWVCLCASLWRSRRISSDSRPPVYGII